MATKKMAHSGQQKGQGQLHKCYVQRIRGTESYLREKGYKKNHKVGIRSKLMRFCRISPDTLNSL